MNIRWSDHALERAKERSGVAWGLFRALVERAIESREWIPWWEFDEREARGIRENLLVSAVNQYEKTWVVVRRTEDGFYLVVSVLTEEQYAFNTRRLWSASERGALAEHKRRLADEAKGLSPTTRPLTHNPFANLRKP